jgi:monofunctional biosynthetic peptidoglycan transglycosylase
MSGRRDCAQYVRPAHLSRPPPATLHADRPAPLARSRPPVRRILRLLLLALLAFYGAVALSLVYLRWLRPVTTMVQVQRRVESWFTKGSYDRRASWVTLASLPRHVPRAVVAAEDTRFYLHHGFDFRQLDAARKSAERTGLPPRGASTITQQLVKNLYFTTHRSFVRKGLEMTITPMAEAILGKPRILELYLNVVEWGPGVYGIDAAARHHYRVPARSLTRERAARLAAILPAPRRRRPERMGHYASVIQQRMRAMGW